MRGGVNAGMSSNGPELPARLSALLNRTGRGYATGGAVPQAGAQQMPQAMNPQVAGVQPAAQGQQMNAQQLAMMAQQLAAQHPEIVQHLQQVIEQALQSGQLTMDQLNLAIEMAKAAAQNPALYPRLRQLAIERGLAGPQELPEQYDQGIVFAMLIAAQAVQGTAQPAGQGAPAGRPPGYSHGGSIPQRGSDPSGTKDNIPIKVSGGEYVIPKHVVAAKGTEFFDRMLEQYDPNNPESKVNKPK